MYPYRKIKSVISHIREWNVLHGFRQKSITTTWKNGSPHMPEQCSLPVRVNMNTVMRDITCCKITVHLIRLYMGVFIHAMELSDLRISMGHNLLFCCFLSPTSGFSFAETHCLESIWSGYQVKAAA